MIRSCARRWSFGCTLYDLSPYLDPIAAEMASAGALPSALTHLTYGRWFLPELLPASVDRCVYLDMDTLILGDLRDLLILAPFNTPVAASKDFDIRLPPETTFEKFFVSHLQQLGLSISREKYFNSGVLVLSLRQWREQSITRQLLQTRRKLLEKGCRLTYEDQDVMNVLLHKEIFTFPLSWNVLVPPTVLDHCETKAQILSTAKVLHFVLHPKPWISDQWMYLISPAADAYYNALQISSLDEQRVHKFRLVKRVYASLASEHPRRLPPDNIFTFRAIQMYLQLPESNVYGDSSESVTSLLRSVDSIVEDLIVDEMRIFFKLPSTPWLRKLRKAWRFPRKVKPGSKWRIRRRFLSAVLTEWFSRFNSLSESARPAKKY